MRMECTVGCSPEYPYSRQHRYLIEKLKWIPAEVQSALSHMETYTHDHY